MGRRRKPRAIAGVPVGGGIPARARESRSGKALRRSLVQWTSGQSGEACLRTLTRRLAEALGTHWSMAGVLVPGKPGRVRTLAWWDGKDWGEPFDHDPAGTPCQRVLEGKVFFQHAGLRKAYPGDRVLAALGAESYMGAPLRGGGGEVLGYLAVLDDAAMARDLRRTAILRAVAERAGAEVEGLRTEEARRQGEARRRHALKVEAVARLCGVVVRNLGNVLGTVAGSADRVMAETAPGDPRREDLARIQEAVERGRSLSRRLQAVSGQQPARPEVLDPAGLVVEMEPLLRRLVPEGVRLRLRRNGDGATVRADRSHLEQVVVHLVLNARDAVAEGGEIAVGTTGLRLGRPMESNEVLVPPGDHVVLEVADDGGGMDGERRAWAFDPLSTTKAGGEGDGLGLSMVHGMVRQAGGHFTRESEAGRGTVARVYLPRVVASPPVRPEPVRAPGSPRRGETILLVEDDEPLRRATRRVLERRGFRVLEAEDGPGALEVSRAHEGPVHLLVSDVLLPGPGGAEVAERLAGRHPRLKVLYVSGYSARGLVGRGDLPSHGAFLAKPYTHEELLRRVVEVLDGVAEATGG
ncbi:MAG: response regulator [Planctomycetes bacterium]|nr:response regulator [Planctomycetota bacterium]